MQCHTGSGVLATGLNMQLLIKNKVKKLFLMKKPKFKNLQVATDSGDMVVSGINLFKLLIEKLNNNCLHDGSAINAK